MSVLGPQAIVQGLGDGEFNDAFGMRRWFRLTPEQTGGMFAVFEEEIPAGKGPPLHIHRDAQEVFFVMEGRVQFRCSGRVADAGVGTTVLIPQGAEHAFKALEDSRVLITLTPGGGIGFFKEIAKEGLTPETDMDRIAELASEYEIELTGPPL